MKIIDRYASAVRASSLKSEPDTTHSASDVIGAAGLAAKAWRTLPDGSKVPGNPLGIAMMRLLTGDNSASSEIVRILAASLKGKAKRDGPPMKWIECEDMARGVLAWYRHGACTRCGGHGYSLIEGTRTVGDHACPHCRGTGKILFDLQWPMERILLARWLLAEVEREQAIAGAAAMAALAPRLDL